MQYIGPVSLLLDLFCSLYTVYTSFEITIFKASVCAIVSETWSELNKASKIKLFAENP